MPSGAITAAPAGFFALGQIGNTQIEDLVSATNAALSAVTSLEASVEAAEAAATAAETDATNAANALSSIGTSVTDAAASATAAAASDSDAATQATNAASSASAASTFASGASTSASTATTEAGTATTQATAAASSATAAASSAASASSSATTATTQATTATTQAGIATTAASAASAAATTAANTAVAPAFNDFGRNKLHNGLFNIAQRGAGAFTTAVYGLDRWVMQLTGDTVSVTQAALADADRTAIGDLEAVSSLQNVFTGASSAADYNCITQRIENVYRLALKTVTVSFWAVAATGTPSLGVSIDQNFGSSGSTTVTGAGTAVPISTTWTRYAVTFSIGTVAGKTIGAGNYTGLNLWYSSAATNATRAGSIGVQSGTIQVWGVQLEVGSTETQLEKLDPALDLSNCQRFYQTGEALWTGSTGAAATFTMSTSLVVQMRAVPTVVGASIASNNATSITYNPGTVNFVYTQFSVGSTLAWEVEYTFKASADL